MNFILNNKISKVAVVYFAILVIWWLRIFLYGGEIGIENYLFNLSYFFFNSVGGIGGIYISYKKWGGTKSAIGKGLIFLGLGLLGQGFGLLIWTYYNLVLQVEIPYPSLADIGYFSLIPFYTIAMIYFAKASGVKFALRTMRGKIQLIIIPLVALGISYGLFIRAVGFDWSDPVRLFLDIGYPAGEAFSISLGILTYNLSRGLLGGKMKKRVLFIICALSLQYIVEFTFLYTSGLDLYYNAGFVDMLYATSYFTMMLGLFSFSKVDY